MLRKLLIKGSGQDGSHILKSLADKAAAHINGAEVVPKGCGLVKDEARIVNCFDESVWVAGTAADVEGDADDVEVELAAELEEGLGGVEGGAKFEAEPAEAGGVVR